MPANHDNTPPISISTIGVAIVKIIPEFLFVILPILIIFIVFWTHDHLDRFILSPEWSFASAIFFGSSIIKLVNGISAAGSFFDGFAELFIAIIIIFGLAPSLTILAMIVIAEDHPDTLLVNIQLSLFIASAVSFLILGIIGACGLELEKIRSENDSE
jgi:hypothetical protein